jgi:hypothetical protein
MTPARLDECLSIIRWTPDTLARCFGCDVSLVDAWLTGELEMPMKAGIWLDLVAQHHEAFEATKPTGLKGKRFKA